MGEGGGDPVIDVVELGLGIGQGVGRNPEPLLELPDVLVEKPGEDVDRVVEPIGQRLVLGDPDQRRLVVVTVGLDEPRQDHPVQAGDIVRVGGDSIGADHFQLVAVFPDNPLPDLPGEAPDFLDQALFGQDITILDPGLDSGRLVQGQQ